MICEYCKPAAMKLVGWFGIPMVHHLPNRGTVTSFSLHLFVLWRSQIFLVRYIKHLWPSCHQHKWILPYLSQISSYLTCPMTLVCSPEATCHWLYPLGHAASLKQQTVWSQWKYGFGFSGRSNKPLLHWPVIIISFLESQIIKIDPKWLQQFLIATLLPWVSVSNNRQNKAAEKQILISFFYFTVSYWWGALQDM